MQISIVHLIEMIISKVSKTFVNSAKYDFAADVEKFE